MVFEKEELDSLKVLSDSRIDDVWPLIIRIQEAEQKDQQVLFLYVKFGQVEGKGNQIQAIIVDQKLELPNPVSPDGLTSFRLSPVFLSSPNSNTPSPCLICLNEVANLVSLPCGHLALGDLCIKTYFEKNDNRLCLVCRQEVKELVSISDSGYDFEKASEHRRQLEKQDEMKQTENNLKSREVSPGIGTRTENILKHGTIISESNNLDGESIIDNNHYIRGKDILKYPLKKDIESNLDDQMSDEENRDKVGSFNPLTFNKSMKKDIDRTSDLQFKGKNIFGSSTAKNSKEKISFENDHKRVKDLEDTGLANRKSEPQLKPKKK